MLTSKTTRVLAVAAAAALAGWSGSVAHAGTIASGYEFGVAIRPDQTVDHWGQDFAPPQGLRDVVSLAIGYQHAFALRSDGTITGWGYNDSGQADTPDGITDFIGIAAGAWHSVGLRANGSVVAWGNNNAGQASVPAGLNNVTAVAAGYHHNLALKSDGTVAAWGFDNFGITDVPAGLSNVVAISARGYQNVALKADGTVVAWGQNNHGQSNVPAGLTDVVAVAAGENLTLALKSDGRVIAWGNASSIGNAGSWFNVASIAAGANNAHAITRDGTILAAGTFGEFEAVNPPGGTYSTDAVWSGMTGGQFLAGHNWQGNTPSTAASKAVFSLDRTYNVNFTTNSRARAIDITDGSVTFALGTHSYQVGGDVTVTDGSLYLPGMLRFGTAGAGELGVGRALNLDGGFVSADDIDLGGSVARLNWTSGTLLLNKASGLVAAGQTLQVNTGQNLVVQNMLDIAGTLEMSGGSLWAGGISGNGTLRINHGNFRPTGSAADIRFVGGRGAVIQLTQDLYIGKASRVDGFHTDGEIYTGRRQLTLLDANRATLGLLTSLGDGSGDGRLAAANGLFVDYDGNIVGRGTIETSNLASKASIINGAVVGDSIENPITFTGYVKGAGTFDNVVFAGTYSPGLSPTQQFVGNIGLGESNHLVMELGGLVAGSEHDQIVISGEMALNGTLSVELIDGFVPSEGDSFLLFDGPMTGSFHTLHMPSLPTGLQWQTGNLTTTGLLTVVPEPATLSLLSVAGVSMLRRRRA